MLDLDLIKSILIIAMSASIITTAFVQKIKEAIDFKKSSKLVFVSLIVSMVIGTLFALTFSSVSFVSSLWVGLISFIGADTLYKMFEEKLFKPYSEMYKQDKVEIEKQNIIK